MTRLRGGLRRGVLASALLALGLGIHELVQGSARPPLTVESPLQDAIPFVPSMIWVYLSFFPFVIFVAARIEEERLAPVLRSCALACLTVWGFVLVFPVSFGRPDAGDLDSPLYRHLFGLLHDVDPAHITFPSLHVAITWICCLALRRQPGHYRRVGMAIGISLSTVLVRQHLLSDVLGGLALALAIRALARVGRREDDPQEAPG